MTITLAGAEEPREPRRFQGARFPGAFEGLEYHLGQNSYRQYMSNLREKKEALAGVKQNIDRITGRWSGILALIGKADKADLRHLVDQEICVLGDISGILDNMTQLYGGERERLLAYFDLLQRRLEEAQGHKPAELVPIEQPTNTLALIKSIKARVHNGFQILIGNRQAVIERQTHQYAQESVALMDQCQQAYGVFLTTGDQVRHAYEHLQHTGPALVSLIELNEARKVVGKSVGDVKAITGSMYSTVQNGYLQLTGFLQQHRVPFLNPETKRIDFFKE